MAFLRLLDSNKIEIKAYSIMLIITRRQDCNGCGLYFLLIAKVRPPAGRARTYHGECTLERVLPRGN